MSLYHYKLNELFIKVILFFPITTLFQYQFPLINKLFFTLSIILLLTDSLLSKINKKIFIWVLVSFAIWFLAFIQTSSGAFKANINMAFYYIFCVLYFIFFIENHKKIWKVLQKNSSYITFVILSYTIIVTISFFFSSSYTSIAQGWGEGKYFVSITDSPNRIGPASLYVMILIIFLLINNHKKWIAIMALPQLYVFFMGGSRTYFVLGLCSFVILYYVFLNSKHMFYLSLVPLFGILLLFTLKSSMIEKFAATFITGTSRSEFLVNITNRRSTYWTGQINLFKSTSFLHHIIGNGINFTTYYYGFWAHNDFIEILCSYGYLGLINYIAIIYCTIKKFLMTKKNNVWIIIMLSIFIWLFNANINFFYCYFCAMLSYPILLLSLYYYKPGNAHKKILVEV